MNGPRQRNRLLQGRGRACAARAPARASAPARAGGRVPAALRAAAARRRRRHFAVAGPGVGDHRRAEGRPAPARRSGAAASGRGAEPRSRGAGVSWRSSWLPRTSSRWEGPDAVQCLRRPAKRGQAVGPQGFELLRQHKAACSSSRRAARCSSRGELDREFRQPIATHRQVVDVATVERMLGGGGLEDLVRTRVGGQLLVGAVLHAFEVAEPHQGRGPPARSMGSRGVAASREPPQDPRLRGAADGLRWLLSGLDDVASTLQHARALHSDGDRVVGLRGEDRFDLQQAAQAGDAPHWCQPSSAAVRSRSAAGAAPSAASTRARRATPGIPAADAGGRGQRHECEHEAGEGGNAGGGRGAAGGRRWCGPATDTGRWSKPRQQVVAECGRRAVAFVRDHGERLREHAAEVGAEVRCCRCHRPRCGGRIGGAPGPRHALHRQRQKAVEKVRRRSHPASRCRAAVDARRAHRLLRTRNSRACRRPCRRRRSRHCCGRKNGDAEVEHARPRERSVDAPGCSRA